MSKEDTERSDNASGKRRKGSTPLFSSHYVNTIPEDEQPEYPGDAELEQEILNLVRWNAMAMVVRANKEHSGIGGHISTFASSAVLYEVGQNHFFHAGGDDRIADLVYFQGHASPGMYARAYLEGRLTEQDLHNFRQDLAKGGGITSYPHPYLMPEFWQLPTVSMGLGPIMSIYQARLNRYIEARELMKGEAAPRIWCFPGDGEMDEPESLAGLALAGREKLDNLTWVVNCNLQRLDGPVRGNGKVIQELENVFKGAGWNVIKVIWGSEWDPIFKKDKEGRLLEKLENCVDGDFQRFATMKGSELRQALFSDSDYMRELVADLKDIDLESLVTGGHDMVKVHAAYAAAVSHKGEPTVILTKTVKGYGLGESGEGHNVTHQQKKLDEKGLRDFRDRFGLPIEDKEIPDTPFYKPDEDDPAMEYLLERRKNLGGFLPSRVSSENSLDSPDDKAFSSLFEGSDEEATTTSASVRLLASLLKDTHIGERIVPIIPDEARTFGADALFRQVGIYAANGQVYEPVDKDNLLFYRESEKGQILEEGITEAGSMGSFIAAGTAGDKLGVDLIPFYYFYSMFGFQRIGDLAWAAGDSLARGFMLGATAGRTTLNGEGLQHQDGHSHVLASTYPTILAYDPAFAYEVAAIIKDGLHRMYHQGERIIYYLTLYNEAYAMPAMPEGAGKGILKGLYRFKPGPDDEGKKAHIFASGSIMQEALKAQDLLASEFGVSASVWSATSYKKLRSDCLKVERWNRMHPASEPRESYLQSTLAGIEGPIVAVSDYMRLVPDQIRGWIQQPFASLGTDGFGRSDTHARLRSFYEIDAPYIVFSVLSLLHGQNELDLKELEAAIKKLDIDPEKAYAEFA
jgi:pyruvate dehydrogenase E1 component